MRQPFIVHKEIYRAMAPTSSKRKVEVELRRPLLTGVAFLLRAAAAFARSAATCSRACAMCTPRVGGLLPLDFLLPLVCLACPLDAACPRRDADAARSCDWPRRGVDAARSCDWARRGADIALCIDGVRDCAGVAIRWYTGPFATGGPWGTGRGGSGGLGGLTSCGFCSTSWPFRILSNLRCLPSFELACSCALAIFL